MDNCVLIPGEVNSRVVLNGVEIRMPATKNNLGFELGHIIFMLVAAFQSGTPRHFVGGRVNSMMERVNIIMEENQDIVVRLTEIRR